MRSVRPASDRKPLSLRARLAEAEETLRAIRNGEVDAVVVAGQGGDHVFTLEGAGRTYQMLIESRNEGALTLTADQLILYANHCFAEMVRLPLEQVIGSSFERFLSPEVWMTLQPLLQQTGPSGTKLQVQLSLSGGAQLPVQISIRQFVENGSAAIIGMVVTDMTEARRVAQQIETERLYAQVLEQAAELERRVEERTKQLLVANQELEAFESSVSHDLRGPLRHVTMFASTLIEEYSPQLPTPARAYLDRILSGTRKMNELITAMLEFSSMGKRKLALEPVDVGRMWREVLEEMRPEIGAHPVAVSFGTLPPCLADPILLRQVLINLLGNALKYSRKRDRSVIEIASFSSATDQSCGYSIKDNGVGFDMAHAGRLFDAFHRLSTSRGFEGTGVGLSTVKRIVNRHGGRIWAESAPDAGATFFFTIGPALLN